jgi:hypothetical protein
VEELNENARKRYFIVAVLILNSIFLYGFQTDHNKEPRSPLACKVSHYWEYISSEFPHLETVKYINVELKQEFTDAQRTQQDLNINKGIRWGLIALVDVDDLYVIFMGIFNNPDFLMLYDMEDSYMWNCRKEIFECLEYLKTKGYPFVSRLSLKITNFINFMNKKKARENDQN